MNGTQTPIQPWLMTMRIIAGALVAGSVTFLLVALYIVQTSGPTGGQRPPDAPPILTWMALGLLAVETVVSFVIPPMIERATLARLSAAPPTGQGPADETAILLGTYQTRMIVTMALFEGASFFASIAYLVEGRPLALAVSAAAIAGLLMQFPTEWRLTQWLSERRGSAAALRARPKT
jgi:hypothetical protein